MSAIPTLKEISCLLVAPEKGARKLLAGILRQIGVGSVREADSVDHANVIIRYTGVDLIVWAGSGTGHLELLRFVRQELTGAARKAPVLCVTDKWDMDRLLAARDAGATGFMPLPLTMSGTLRTVNAALADRREFVVYQNYAGPCRRRGTPADYPGPFRRKTDHQSSHGTTRETGTEVTADDLSMRALDGTWQDPETPSPTPRVQRQPTPPTDQTRARDETSDRDRGRGIGNSSEGDWLEGGLGSGSAATTAPLTRTTLFRRRAEVVDEALRLIREMDGLVAGKTAGGGEFNQLFTRTMNLMALIQGYTGDDPSSSDYFKTKYEEIVTSIGQFSNNILSDGLERLRQQTKDRVDGTAPASLGSAQKIYERMTQFEALIATLGGYVRLQTDMLASVRQIWENLLLLADLDIGLDSWDGVKESRLRDAASDNLAKAKGILSSRPAADSQGATLDRLKQKNQENMGT